MSNDTEMSDFDYCEKYLKDFKMSDESSDNQDKELENFLNGGDPDDLEEFTYYYNFMRNGECYRVSFDLYDEVEQVEELNFQVSNDGEDEFWWSSRFDITQEIYNRELPEAQ